MWQSVKSTMRHVPWGDMALDAWYARRVARADQRQPADVTLGVVTQSHTFESDPKTKKPNDKDSPITRCYLVL